jgi:hypothetical protein
MCLQSADIFEMMSLLLAVARHSVNGSSSHRSHPTIDHPRWNLITTSQKIAVRGSTGRPQQRDGGLGVARVDVRGGAQVGFCSGPLPRGASSVRLSPFPETGLCYQTCDEQLDARERTRPTRIPAVKRSTRRGAIRHGPNSRIFPLTGSADRGPSAVDRNNLRRDEASTVADEEDQYRSQVRIGVAIVRPQFFIRRRETSCTEREPARKQFR